MKFSEMDPPEFPTFFSRCIRTQVITIRRNATGRALGYLMFLGLMMANGNCDTIFYVAPEGNDQNPGTNPGAPWQSLDKINNRVFGPGDQILFKTGGHWIGQLWPKGSGSAAARCMLGSYGTGPKPVIDAHGASGSAAVKLYNQEYWTIENLEVANWANGCGTRYGIWIWGDDGKIKHGFRILNNTVRDVYASPTREGNANCPSFYTVGGIYVNIKEPGHADTVLI